MQHFIVRIDLTPAMSTKDLQAADTACRGQLDGFPCHNARYVDVVSSYGEPLFGYVHLPGRSPIKAVLR